MVQEWTPSAHIMNKDTHTDVCIQDLFIPVSPLFFLMTLGRVTLALLITVEVFLSRRGLPRCPPTKANHAFHVMMSSIMEKMQMLHRAKTSDAFHSLGPISRG